VYVAPAPDDARNDGTSSDAQSADARADSAEGADVGAADAADAAAGDSDAGDSDAKTDASAADAASDADAADASEASVSDAANPSADWPSIVHAKCAYYTCDSISSAGYPPGYACIQCKDTNPGCDGPRIPFATGCAAGTVYDPVIVPYNGTYSVLDFCAPATCSPY
jgi:hypothetical protein